MSKKSHRQEFHDVFSKNYFRTLKLFWSTPELFLPGIDEIRQNFEIPDLPPIEPAKNKKDYDKLLDIGQKTLNAFLKKNESKYGWISGKLKGIRKKLKLGREWNKTFLIYIVSGITLPPPFSVFINVDEDDDLIIFEISKDTTKADLDLAWKNIEKDRIRIFGKARSSFPFKKTIRNFIKDTEAKVIKFEKPYMEDGKGEKYKTTDKNVIGELFTGWSKKVDEKRVNRLRVNKSRFKKM